MLIREDPDAGKDDASMMRHLSDESRSWPVNLPAIYSVSETEDDALLRKSRTTATCMRGVPRSFPALERRQFLLLSGSTIASALLSACGSGEGNTPGAANGVVAPALWQQFADQLIALTMPGFDNRDQFVTFAWPATAVDLANANPEISNYNIYLLGNTVPARSASYAPYSTLCQSYQLFLSSILLSGNAGLTSQINIAAGNVTAAQNNYTEQYSAAAIAYQTYTTINAAIGVTSLPFASWVTTNYPTYSEAYNALLAAQLSYDQLMNQAYGPGYQQLAAANNAVNIQTGALNTISSTPYNMAVQTGSVAPAGSAAVLPGQTPPPASNTLVTSYVPAYVLDSAFVATYRQWQSRRGTVRSQDDSIALNFSRASVETRSARQHVVTANGGPGAFLTFFHSASVGTRRATEFVVQDESANISISFGGLGAFRVSPGSWFQQGVVDAFRNSLGPGSPQFFGPQGIMGLLPYQILVGYMPAITVSLGKSYSRFQTIFQQETTKAVSVGPFLIERGASSTLKGQWNVKFDDQARSVTITSTGSSVPVLLAVVCKIL